MPLYEFTMIIRSMPKNELMNVIARTAGKLMEKGAVITKMDSMGHNDLAIARIHKTDKSKHFHGNTFLLTTHMPLHDMHTVHKEILNDEDILRHFFLSHDQFTSFRYLKDFTGECTLEEELKPAVERESVRKLRASQRMMHLTRQKAYHNQQKEWRRTPKSFFVDRAVK